ncbi:MAG: hypothetical protein PHW94_02355 [Sulfurimonas sp.]|nr:hypothetical protein [Sulfurimonas sp.]
MKKEILERYERNEDGTLIIDVSTEKIEDLYNDFDKQAHFLKKDLNEDLVLYLVESVSEIGSSAFIIKFNFEVNADAAAILRVRESIKNFFIYMQELTGKKVASMLRSSLIFLLIGLIMATLSILLNQSDLVKEYISVAVFAEGLTVAAWVSLWEALATFLIKWMPLKKKIALYHAIANAKIAFKFHENSQL